MLLSSKEHSRWMAQKWDGSSPNYILQLCLKKKQAQLEHLLCSPWISPLLRATV